MIMFSQFNTERWITFAAMIIVLIMAVVDVFEDLSEGNALWFIVVDVVLQGFVILTLSYIFVYMPKSLKAQNRLLEHKLRDSHRDTDMWREKASSLLEGLGQKIDEQLTYWQLSDAEKQVVLLILKGLSFKECAQVREVSEKTIRQQASSIYSKSGLTSRSALSAFFLEDLLLPNLDN